MNSLYQSCTLCPRKCGIDRTKSTGFCHQTDEIRAARAALHYWEEPCLSGKAGSGTVFFCGCTLGCVYCQNRVISDTRRPPKGRIIPPERLAEIFMKLEAQGALNINLVTPTMFIPGIIKAIDLARRRGLSVPIVYNTGGYERPESLALLDGKIDIYLPDFKYLSPALAARYSMAGDYPQAASAAIEEMVRQTGEAVFDENGIMRRGVIVRHLLLPGQLEESRRVLAYLYGKYQNRIWYSLMSQYTPVSTLDTAAYPELARRVTTYEYRKLIDFAKELGITNGFIQDGRSVGESFIPAFDNQGI